MVFSMVSIPKCSMYGIFTYIWVIFGVNVGKYSIHGAYGILGRLGKLLIVEWKQQTFFLALKKQLLLVRKGVFFVFHSERSVGLERS